MKAPNRIYLDLKPALDIAGIAWLNHPEDKIEYIRKDALLEWFAERYEDTDRVSVETVIDKIKEL